MDSKKILQNDVRKKIFMSIHDNDSVKFNELKGFVEIESNDLSYHLKKLVDSGLVNKNEFDYSLSLIGKEIVPYLSIITENASPLLVVTSVALIQGDKLFLQAKPREPEKGKLIFFGGKVMSDVLIEDAARAHVLKQAGCQVKNLKLRCVNEFMKQNVFHGVVYFFTAEPVGEVVGVTRELSNLDYDELLWDNKFFAEKMLDSETVQVVKTIL